MNRKYSILMFFLFMNSFIFSQHKISISGKVSEDKKTLQDVAVELKFDGVSKFSITNKNGDFGFNNILIGSDSVSIKVNYLGYKPYLQKIKIQEKLVIDINLIIESPELLNEVIIKANEKNQNTAKKSSYKINQKEFIKNAKAIDVLNTIPNVYCNKFDGKTIVDGKLEAKLFVDGIEMMSDELKGIDVEEIERVEVLNNPSSKYGTDFVGAVINVILKKKTNEYLKSSISITQGLINNFSIINPSFSYKRGKFILKSNFRYLRNEQEINYNLNRINNGETFLNNSLSNSIGTQPSSETRIKININEKSNLSFTSEISSYKFASNTNGNTVLNNLNFANFIKKGENSTTNLNLASVYNYKFKENQNIFFKANYKINTNRNTNTFMFNDLSSLDFDIQSKSNEFTTNIVYETEEQTILKVKSAIYTDLKYINRNFIFSENNFYVNQNVLNGSLEIDNEWSDSFSTETAFTLENTYNKTSNSSQNYNLILPTFNALYHFKNKIDLKFGYSRKILRPNAADLNGSVIVYNPGIAKQGNSNLDPQIRNYYSLNLIKKIKSTNFSLKLYNESINNAISEVYNSNGTLLIQTLANASKFNSSGISLGSTSIIFKKINMNLNFGLDYNLFEDNSPSSLVKKNEGFSFNGNFSLSSSLFKNKLAVSFSGRQNGPEYSLLSRRINLPYLDFNLSTNLFKNKLSLGIYVRGLLGNWANEYKDVSNYNNFIQNIVIKNNTSNILLNLTYNFGKKFDDTIDKNNINNNDLRK